MSLYASYELKNNDKFIIIIWAGPGPFLEAPRSGVRFSNNELILLINFMVSIAKYKWQSCTVALYSVGT